MFSEPLSCLPLGSDRIDNNGRQHENGVVSFFRSQFLEQHLEHFAFFSAMDTSKGLSCLHHNQHANYMDGCSQIYSSCIIVMKLISYGCVRPWTYRQGKSCATFLTVRRASGLLKSSSEWRGRGNRWSPCLKRYLVIIDVARNTYGCTVPESKRCRASFLLITSVSGTNLVIVALFVGVRKDVLRR